MTTSGGYKKGRGRSGIYGKGSRRRGSSRDYEDDDEPVENAFEGMFGDGANDDESPVGDQQSDLFTQITERYGVASEDGRIKN